ncbi:MAG: anaerobic carbon-monoxide dehydrogenase, complex subunit alpha [Archaeoglobi archaeon]|nr:anaerobic carbon-monoxide dehydrogenase, complex subunit alpha [Archaeoglobi archaeon]
MKTKFSVEKFESRGISLKNLEVLIGEVIEEDEWEPMGPYPFPSAADLRDWDFKLLKRYKPFYAPYDDTCSLCTLGKCDLTGNKKGACGIDLRATQGRIVLLACLVGTSAHVAHARHLYEDIVKMFGKDLPVDLGGEIEVEAPLTRLITGIRPKKISDFEPVLEYIEEQLVQMMDALHTGQEGSHLDFESKALHVGMLDSLGKEVADILQIVAFNFPKGDADAPLVEMGLGTMNPEKPTILVVGHNVPPAIDIADYLIENGLEDKVDIAGICCTSLDITRYYPNAKIVAALSRQLKAIRSGLADVIVVDEQCIRADVLEQARRVRAPLIATMDKALHGLPDRTNDDPDEIVEDLVSGKLDGVAILDSRKVGEVAVKVALRMHELRKDVKSLPSDEELKELVNRCIHCNRCTLACPQNLKISEANRAAKAGDFSKLQELYEYCISCMRCEQVCPVNIPINDVIMKAALPLIRNEIGKVRAGRGPIKDTEIRNVGAPIVLGTIPGIIAAIGCDNNPKGAKDVWLLVKEFLERRFIVTVSGCAAINLGLYKDEDGETLYEKYPGEFDAGGLVNVGSCVANAHIHGAAIKVASIFARRKLRGNYDEIADYILNRVGACGVAWGAYSQKAASIATGFNRLGVPAVVGPHGVKYRRAFLGRRDKEEDWVIYNARDGSQVRIEPAPEHLLVSAETIEEAIPLVAKLCMRPNDTPQGRQIKLTHYLDLSMKYLKSYPDDWHLFVRSEADLPLARKDELLKMLEDEHGWKIDWSTKRILEGPLRKVDPSFDPTNLERLVRK